MSRVRNRWRDERRWNRFGALAGFAIAAGLCFAPGCRSSKPGAAGGASTFAKSYGGEDHELALRAIPTRDGGYAFVGLADDRPWFAKLDAFGDVEWQRVFSTFVTFGETWAFSNTAIRAAALAPDGGFCVVGSSWPDYFYVARLDADLELDWEVKFDGPEWPNARATGSTDNIAVATVAGPDDNCFMAGHSYSERIALDDDSEVLDAVSIVIASVDEDGPRWETRHFAPDGVSVSGPDRHSPGATLPLRAPTLLATAQGGLAVAYAALTPANGVASHIRFEVYDEDGDRTGDAAIDGALDRTQPLAVCQVDDRGEDGGRDGVVDDGFALASPYRLHKLDGTGQVRWSIGSNGSVSSTSESLPHSTVVGVAEHCSDTDSCVIAVFGRDSVGYWNSDTADQLGGGMGLGRELELVTQLSRDGRYRLYGRHIVDGEIQAFVSTFDTSALQESPRQRVTAKAATGILQDGVFRIVEGRELVLYHGDGSVDRVGAKLGVEAIRQLVEVDDGVFLLSLGTRSVVLQDGRLVEERSYTLGGEPAFPAASYPIDGGAAVLLVSEDGLHSRVVEVDRDADLVGAGKAATAHDEPTGGLEVRSMPGGGYVYLLGKYPATLVRVDSDSTVEWARTIEESVVDFDVSPDGDIVVLSYSDDLASLWLFDDDGEAEWQRRYRWQGSTMTLAGVRAIPDGGFAIAATINNFYHGDAPDPLSADRNKDWEFDDLALLRIDDDGDPEWMTIHGSAVRDVVLGLAVTEDGGFVLAGHSLAFGTGVDAWLLRLGPDGEVAPGCNAHIFRVPGSWIRTEALPLYEPWSNEFADASLSAAAAEEHDFDIESRDYETARQCLGFPTADSPEAGATRRLRVVQSGSLRGLVTSQLAGIFCGDGPHADYCEANLERGSSVLITVDDSSAREFRGFGANACDETFSDPDRCLVELDANRDVEVFFEPDDGDTSMLAITVEGSGRVVGFGIDCTSDPSASDCGHSYPEGQQVQLFIEEGEGERFMGWDGDCAEFGTAASLQLTATGNVSCSARFSGPGEPVRHQLTVELRLDGDPVDPEGAFGGGVVSVPAGIDCDPGRDDCVGDFVEGVEVQLRALARPAGYEFVGWTSPDAGNPCTDSSENPINLTLEESITCVANFATVDTGSVPLSVQVLTDGAVVNDPSSVGGHITSAPEGIDCREPGANCVATFPEGSAVTLTAVQETGYRFAGWSSSTSGSACTDSTQQQIQLTLTEALTCTADFVSSTGTLWVLQTQVIIGARPSNSTYFGGRVTSAPPGISCSDSGSDCSQLVADGSQVTLIATPDPGFQFLRWDGDDPNAGCNSMTSPTVSVTMADNLICAATFRALPSSDPGSLTVSFDGPAQSPMRIVEVSESALDCTANCTVDVSSLGSSPVRLRAIPGSGTTFGGWGGCDAEVVDPQDTGGLLLCEVDVSLAARSVVVSYF